jgi:hypothetical protein
VLAAIDETIINLIGSEDFAVYELDDGRQTLRLASSFAELPEPYRCVPLGGGPIGQLAQRGETWLCEPGAAPEMFPGGKRVQVVVPLRLDTELCGAIALFGLLPQKSGGIEEVDRELFDLLATHAAVALYSTRLYGQSGAAPGAR